MTATRERLALMADTSLSGVRMARELELIECGEPKPGGQQ
jgi:hypothetical protein